MFVNTVLLRKVIILALIVQLQTHFSWVNQILTVLCLIDEFTCVAVFSWLRDPKSGKLLVPDGFMLCIFIVHIGVVVISTLAFRGDIV